MEDSEKRINDLIEYLEDIKKTGGILETAEAISETRQAHPGDKEFSPYWEAIVGTGRVYINLTVFKP